MSFLFPPVDEAEKVKMIHRDLQADVGMSKVDFFDGSVGSYAGFLGPKVVETEATADDTKPPAVPQGDA